MDIKDIKMGDKVVIKPVEVMEVDKNKFVTLLMPDGTEFVLEIDDVKEVIKQPLKPGDKVVKNGYLAEECDVIAVHQNRIWLSLHGADWIDFAKNYQRV